MKTDGSPRHSRLDLRCAGARLLLLALGCAQWGALWILVFRKTFGM
jgi:hypothetical protein